MEETVAPWEDTRAFLASFEQVAQACRWTRGEWAARLVPALSGAAEEAFQRLDATHRADYEKVKAAILRAEALRMEKQRQHFRHFTVFPGETDIEGPRRICSLLQQLCHRWLKPERRSKEQILDMLVLEQFVLALPWELQAWVQERGAHTSSQAVSLAEAFLREQKEAEDEEKEQAHLMEKTLGPSVANEEAPEAVKRQTRQEAQQKRDVDISARGTGIHSSGHDPKSLSLEGQETNVKQEPTFLETALNNPTHPVAQESLHLEVQSENTGNQETLGDRRGNQGKMKDSCAGRKETEDMWRNPGEVLEEEGPCEEGSHATEEEGKETMEEEGKRPDLTEGRMAARSQPMDILTREERTSRGDGPQLEPANPYPPEEEEGCSASENILQEFLCSGKRRTGENRSSFGKEGKERDRDRPLGHPSEGKAHPSFQGLKRSHYTRSSREGKQGAGREGGTHVSPHWRNFFGHISRLRNQKELCTPEKRGNSEKTLPSRKGSVRYQRIHTGDKPHKCSQCRKTFCQRTHLKIHQRIHTGEKPYKCSQCGKTFSLKCILKRHERIHTGEKPYKCSQCGKRFLRRTTLKEDQRIHTGQKPYKCSQCGKRFSVKSNLKRHERIHTGEKPYKCSQCGKSFRLRYILTQHERFHMGKKPYKCSQCGKSFSFRNILTKHQRIHTGEKPYKCSHCGKRFSLKWSLKRHERIHTGEKPYKCPQCEKTFSQSEHLKKHEGIHTGEKSYRCSQCGKLFGMKNNLKQHQRVHRRPKTYNCLVCRKIFTERRLLNDHRRFHMGCEKILPQEEHVSQKVYLEDYQAIHKGHKTFRCLECGAKASQTEMCTRQQGTSKGARGYKCQECGKTYVLKVAMIQLRRESL